jgi:predicted TIM-barrel fold metal-dependent hydrolase
MHLWDLESSPFGVSYGWLRGPNQAKEHIVAEAEKFEKIRKSYFLQHYLEDTKNENIVKFVHVEADCDNYIGETQWLDEIASKFGYPNAFVARANLSDPKVEEILCFHAKYSKVKGIRQSLNYHPKNSLMCAVNRSDYVKDSQWRRGFALLQKYGFSFDLQIWPSQVNNDIIELAAAFPSIQLIVNHTALPFGYLDPSEEAEKIWRDAIQKLSSRSNVVIKLSGLAMTDHNLSFDYFRSHIEYAIQCFGTDRCMFGSNFPVDKVHGDYHRLLEIYRQCLTSLPLQDQRKCFHDNAVRFYHLS